MSEQDIKYAEKLKFFADKFGLDYDLWCVKCQKDHRLKGGRVEECKKK